MHKTLQPKLILVAILAAYSAPQYALAEDKTEAIALDKVEVISTTPLPSVGLPINQIPSNVQTVKAKDLERTQSLDITEYMNRNMGGVYINEVQNNPLQPDLNYRGYTASPLLGTPQGLSVYMDGVRMNQPFGDVVSWDLIPKNAIANMQLMPGSNPLFGLNTLGGAVSIQTKDGRNSPGGAVQFTYGSNARKMGEFEYGDSKDNIDWFIAGTAFDENGWRDASESDYQQLFGKIGWHGDKTDAKLTTPMPIPT
jgi:outer membrane cobalamin receptor